MHLSGSLNIDVGCAMRTSMRFTTGAHGAPYNNTRPWEYIKKPLSGCLKAVFIVNKRKHYAVGDIGGGGGFGGFSVEC